MARIKQQIAVDIGTRCARAVWVTLRGGKPVITRAESFALPLDADDPHKLISAWVSSLGLTRHFCSLALPGSQTIFQCGRILHNDPRTPEQVAAMDIAQFNDMAGDEMHYSVSSFEVPFLIGTRLYLMAMARPSAINESLNAIRLNHLRPADLIPAPVALFNAMQALSKPHEETRCYLSIGHTASEIAIGNSNGLFFARSIPVGAKLFTDAIVQATGLPAIQAEVRKHADCGLRESDSCYEELRKAADRWLAQLSAALGVYRSQFNDRKFQITGFVISGGGAQLKGLKEYLAAKLFLPVQNSCELDALPPAHKERLGAYDLAYGLAVSAMRQGVTRLSLLPQDLQNEVVFRTKKPWWIATALFLFATMAIYSATGMVLLRRDGHLLQSERDKLAQRERIDKQIIALRQAQQRILTNAVPLSALLVNAPVARTVLTLASQCVDPEDWITLFCDEQIYNLKEQELGAADASPQAAVKNPFSLFRTIRPTAKAPAGGKQALPERKELIPPLTATFIIEGYTARPNLESVRQMLNRLKSSPVILRADLRRDDQVLAPIGIPELEEEKLPDFKRFVLEIEVRR